MPEDKFNQSSKVLQKNKLMQIVGGWFSVFKFDGETVRDTDNEEVDLESYREAYLDFTKNYRKSNFDHDPETDGNGVLIDNILIDSEEMAKMLVHEITGMPFEDIVVKRLGHFGSFQLAKEEDFKDACEGKLMFSIEGDCTREEIDG
ncbi:hypothetical protein S0112_068 [Shewanella phage S0112]|nr:hypothetical protein S0112_068 [Shewanella phage S0112]